MKSFRKYLSYFKLKFYSTIMYRGAALAGIATQFAWGFLYILLFKSLFSQKTLSFVSMEQMSTYIWLQQAFFSTLFFFGEDNSIYEEIKSGNFSFDLLKPIDLYNTWFYRNLGHRLAKCSLRALPPIIIASFLPKPFNLSLPYSKVYFLLFIISLFLTLLLTISMNMFMYILVLKVLNYGGIRLFFGILIDLLSGAEISLFFYPEAIRKILDILPTGSLGFLTYRIYFGYFNLKVTILRILLQIIYLIIFITFGKLLLRKSVKHVIVQGG